MLAYVQKTRDIVLFFLWPNKGDLFFALGSKSMQIMPYLVIVLIGYLQVNN